MIERSEFLREIYFSFVSQFIYPRKLAAILWAQLLVWVASKSGVTSSINVFKQCADCDRFVCSTNVIVWRLRWRCASTASALIQTPWFLINYHNCAEHCFVQIKIDVDWRRVYCYAVDSINTFLVLNTIANMPHYLFYSDLNIEWACNPKSE